MINYNYKIVEIITVEIAELSKLDNLQIRPSAWAHEIFTLLSDVPARRFDNADDAGIIHEEFLLQLYINKIKI